jgi:hypothetical protein
MATTPTTAPTAIPAFTPAERPPLLDGDALLVFVDGVDVGEGGARCDDSIPAVGLVAMEASELDVTADEVLAAELATRMLVKFRANVVATGVLEDVILK